MPASKNTQSGFSLVEMLVAVMILAVGLLGLAQLQVTAMKANSQSTTSTAVIALAQQAVEEVAAWPADDARLNSESFDNSWGAPIEVAGAGSYTISYDVEEVLSDPASATSDSISNLYKITIRVASQTNVMHVLGNQQRKFSTTTLKRAI